MKPAHMHAAVGWICATVLAAPSATERTRMFLALVWAVIGVIAGVIATRK